jgi:hypothetical protein
MAKAAKKGKGSGGQAAKQRQQQEAAARRRGLAPAATGRQVVPSASGAAAAKVAAPAAERWYLDVSALRIQEWLARTPGLRFRRGASVLLSEATEAKSWKSHLPAGTEWNTEAGDIDGVVSLVLCEQVDVPAPVEDTARRAAAEVIRIMRERMPYIHIQAVLGQGPTYAQAYAAMKRDRQDGTVLLDSPPAPQELVLAKPCDQCRSEPAVHQDVEIIKNKAPGDRDPDLCSECNLRWPAGGGTSGSRRSPRPERELLRVLGAPVEDLADDFAELAEGGRFRRDDAATQVALLYADGNRVGDFLDRAGKARGKAVNAREIVRLIDEATIDALADAVSDRFPGWKRPAVIAHLAGGDDLLISVPAVDAWQFTRALLTSFGARTRQVAPQGVSPPTISAALVFAHRSHPFSDLVRIAGKDLKAAKAATRGTEAAVSFRDLTADGGEQLTHRAPLTLAYLDRHAAEFAGIEQIPPSRRQALMALLRQGAVDDAIRRLTDFEDNRPLWDVIAGRGATPAQVREELAGSEEKRAELRQLLDIARHWRTQPREEAS